MTLHVPDNWIPLHTITQLLATEPCENLISFVKLDCGANLHELRARRNLVVKVLLQDGTVCYDPVLEGNLSQNAPPQLLPLHAAFGLLQGFHVSTQWCKHYLVLHLKRRHGW